MTKKQRHFWIAQAGGWSLATFLNIVINQLIRPYPGLVTGSVLAMLFGLLTTLAYRELINSQGWKQLPPRYLVFNIFWSVPIVTAGWALSFAVFVQLFGPLFNYPKTTFLNYFLGIFANGNLIILIWICCYFAYQYFNKFSQSEVEKWRLEAIAKEAQLGALKAQVNPHFMFNALNNIRALILEDQNRSREMLTHLSELLRYNFTTSEHQLVSLAKEMDIVQSYLELMSIQYEQRLFAQIDYDQDLAEALVPPMMIQLLVENAIKHGVALLPNGGQVTVVVSRLDNRLYIAVRNSGKLHKKERIEAPSGVGLQNIRERLRLLYENRAYLKVKEEDGEVVAVVVLPIEEVV